MNKDDKSALALFKRFQPRFRKITWRCIGYELESDTYDHGLYGREKVFRPLCRSSFCFKPAHRKFGPCDGVSAESFEEVDSVHWNDLHEKEPSSPDGYGDKPGELIVQCWEAKLNIPPFQYVEGNGDPAKQFELFFADQIAETLLSKLEFFLDIVPDKNPASQDIPFEDRRFVGVISVKGKMPEGVKIERPKLSPQPWQFFVPPTSTEGKAVHVAIRLDEPGKIGDLKVIEKKLDDLLATAG